MHRLLRRSGTRGAGGADQGRDGLRRFMLRGRRSGGEWDLVARPSTCGGCAAFAVACG